jgi:magnesium-transporting ATPase (P-type)
MRFPSILSGKRLSTISQTDAGLVLYCKGAPEVVLGTLQYGGKRRSSAMLSAEERDIYDLLLSLERLNDAHFLLSNESPSREMASK